MKDYRKGLNSMKIFSKSNVLIKDITGQNYITDELVEKKDSPLSITRVIVILVTYFLGYNYFFPMIVLNIFSLFTFTSESYFFWAMAAQLIMCVVTMAIVIIAALPLLKESWYIFKQNKVANLKVAGILYIVLILTNIVLNLIFRLETSSNQESIEMMMQSSMIVVPFMVVIFAPIVEEIVFRGAIYRVMRKSTGKWGGILISAFFFGLVHVLASLLSGDYFDLINIVTYMSMGVYMALAYEKTGSLHTSIAVHMINNGIATALLLFVM